MWCGLVSHVVSHVIISSAVLLSGLDLSDSKVHEPGIRDRLGTTASLCQVIVL